MSLRIYMIVLGLFHIAVVDFSSLCTVFLLSYFLNSFDVFYVKDVLGPWLPAPI